MFGELTEQEVALLDPMDINSFDRGATKNYSESFSKGSDILVYGAAATSIAVSAMMPLVAKSDNFWKEAGTLAAIWLETNMLTLGVAEVVKISARRIRPYAYNDQVPLESKLGPEGKKSFFSRSTSITATNMFFAAKVFSDYHPESRWRPVAWGVAAAVPALTGYMRVKAGMHFPTDVIAGYAFGALVGYFIPHLHKIKPLTEKVDFSLLPYQNQEAKGLTLLVNLK